MPSSHSLLLSLPKSIYTILVSAKKRKKKKRTKRLPFLGHIVCYRQNLDFTRVIKYLYKRSFWANFLQFCDQQCYHQQPKHGVVLDLLMMMKQHHKHPLWHTLTLLYVDAQKLSRSRKQKNFLCNKLRHKQNKTNSQEICEDGI